MARIAEILQALDVLAHGPNVGRPAPGGQRQVVIGRGSHGYLVRYASSPFDDVVSVFAIRHQREAGSRDR
jgi:plasmid stabilization system protein ParE